MGVDTFTIGMRKAKKMGANVPVEPAQEKALELETSKLIELRNDLKATPSAVSVTPAEPVKESASSEISKDEIIKLAQKLGLKFEGVKLEFIKHTYSVTPASKALFKKYCDTLGLNMQDALEESLQDFFKKHGLEYSRIQEAKRS